LWFIKSSGFVIQPSGVIRHSSFVICHFSLMPSALLQRIEQIAKDARFTSVAIAFCDYETSVQFASQGDRWFHAASTIKVALLLAIYKAAEEGRIRLGDTLHVRNRFRSITGGEVFRVAADRDGDPETHKRLGRAMRVHELARAMIVRSSNLATNLLLDYLGIEQIRRVLNDARIEGIRVRRGVEDNHAFDRGINNEVTANGLVQLFRVLCEEQFLRADTREQMLDILRAQEFKSMIPAQLPNEAKVAHKTGEISTVCHDCGIVFLPQRKPYVLAILTEMPPDVETRHAPVAEISRAVFEYLMPERAERKEKKEAKK
jgi:beta-lactamase class A